MEDIKRAFVNPTPESLNYEADNLLEAFRKLLVECNWSHKAIEELFKDIGAKIGMGSFLKFDDRYLLQDFKGMLQHLF